MTSVGREKRAALRRRPARPTKSPDSLTRLVTLLFVLLHYGAGSNFLGTLAVPAALLRSFLDVFVLSLLFRTYTLHVLFSWHIVLSSDGVSVDTER